MDSHLQVLYVGTLEDHFILKCPVFMTGRKLLRGRSICTSNSRLFTSYLQHFDDSKHKRHQEQNSNIRSDRLRRLQYIKPMDGKNCITHFFLTLDVRRLKIDSHVDIELLHCPSNPCSFCPLGSLGFDDICFSTPL